MLSLTVTQSQWIDVHAPGGVHIRLAWNESPWSTNAVPKVRIIVDAPRDVEVLRSDAKVRVPREVVRIDDPEGPAPVGLRRLLARHAAGEEPTRA